MGDYLIRAAAVSDIRHIAEMEEAIFYPPWSEESVSAEITDNKLARYVVAEAGGEIVGYAGVWLILDEGHITNIAVRPGFRRKGIARDLISALILASENEGVEKFTLEVRASNEEAISLYKEMNFEICGVRKNYYDDNGEDAVIMWRVQTGDEK